VRCIEILQTEPTEKPEDRQLTGDEEVVEQLIAVASSWSSDGTSAVPPD
jgi:hypothetical protein